MTFAERACLGFLAAAVAVLAFHQGMWALLHAAGLMPPPFPTNPVGRLGVPEVYNLCFWGGAWGVLFGLVFPYVARGKPWIAGLMLGIVAELVSLFLVPHLKGQPLAHGGVPLPIVLSLLINATWGVGTGLFTQVALVGPSRRL